ncbi:helix-turn-helix domain-containing protein [Allostreptomyces psammosilenae]|uniref:Tetratricopeptide (TPR) repeat protein n=1 Tax=Allostreptomyces psammosilenae TaxID=1892865 RepID=A0A853A479_9ACTN|nr:helix-turn-helix transcriptional regulator [Allostreptomyces psammosilenae]NYI07684.1 tetratricopeptide (TPR) repeat protein [Allostreptomyces psammosilenae]
MAAHQAPDVWLHPELRAAVAAEDWGVVFRVWRRLVGVSQTVLGSRTGLAQSDVSAIERGHRRVTSTEVRQRVVEGLGVPAELLTGPSGSVPRPRRPDDAHTAPTTRGIPGHGGQGHGGQGHGDHLGAGRSNTGRSSAGGRSGGGPPHGQGDGVDYTGAAVVPGLPSLALPSIAPDPDMLDRLTATTTGAVRPDATCLDWLERLLAEHRRAEDTLGSRPLRGIMAQQLRTVVDLHHRARGSVVNRVVRLAAEHAQFMAWLCQDQGEHGAALAWYDRAHDWGLEAGDHDMAATTLSMKSHLAWSTGNSRRCVTLAEAARWSCPDASLGVRGMAAQMAARGHALAGEAEPARRLLREAEALVRGAAERQDNPAWMYFYDETWFRLQRGMAEMHLRAWRTAVELISSGLAQLPETYRRDRAWYRACLAHALVGAGDPEQAASVALATVKDAAEVGRPHSWHELHATAALLVRRRSRHGRELVEALRAHD